MEVVNHLMKENKSEKIEKLSQQAEEQRMVRQDIEVYFKNMVEGDSGGMSEEV